MSPTADVKAAKARLEEAQSILGKYQAEVDRWDVQVARIEREVNRQVIAPQILLESQKELKADIAARDAAKATIAKAAAELQADEATLARAEVNVAVTACRPRRGRERGEAAGGVGRLPQALGTLRRDHRGPERQYLGFRPAQSGRPHRRKPIPRPVAQWQAAPIYVVDRTDIVRIFVDIPERDANYVQIGSEARVKLWAYRDEWLPATVNRLSWALNVKSRTMRAEIDLPNRDTQLLPGMYAYGKVIVVRPSALSIPKSAIVHGGGKSFLWRYEDRRARRTEVQTGVSDGNWIEVTNHRLDLNSNDEETWEPFNGSEQVLVGSKLTLLTEGARVRVSPSSSPSDGESAGTTTAANESD